MIKWRARLLQLTLTGFLAVIMVRTVYLQTVEAERLSRLARQQLKHASLPENHRGEIVDRYGIPLAIDTYYYEATPENSAAKAKAKEVLGLNTLDNVRLTPHQVRQLREADISGLKIIPRLSRSYPQGSLAAHIMGYVGWDKHGRGGVEQSLDTKLVPKASATVPAQADGKPSPRRIAGQALLPSASGKRRIRLTIDSRLQHEVEDTLTAALENYRADRTTAIVLTPRNGEILAWGVVPSYDPNRYASYRNERTTNWALSTVYEPGSTFKILTVASALEEDAIDEDFTFLDEGTLDVGGVTIHNHDFEPGSEPRKLDLTGLFRHSSNTAAAHIALRMPPEAFRSRLRRFGIGRKTGISLPGESAGVLRPASDWEELDLATTGFGQGMVAVTPLQMAAAVATIANDGKWLPPTLTASRSGHSRGRRAISERVAETILESLTEASTEDGPQVGNLAIAGKTGTAQKFCRAQGTYCRNQTIASYVGLFPVPEPRFLVLVVVDSPRAAGGWGNTVAMPIFEEIARDVWMRYPRLREERFSL